MEDFKPGDEVLLKETMVYDTIWTVTFVEGTKIYCVFCDETHGYVSAIFDSSLLKLDVKPQLRKPQG